ncbi:J domain-containing protein [Kribbella sp. HUAS MG21]|uniref:J domain-containing protein n=1 Tax=Kribbella sp. HUAS MG21 TaxID=3160966 RepID=A0AAU7T6B4_9ACTN
MTPDPYGVLNVAQDATDEELDRAFRILVRRLHPDTRGAGPDAEADRQLQELLTAYAHLRDPIRRAAYDRARRTQPTITHTPATTARAARRRADGPDLWIGPVRWEPAP